MMRQVPEVASANAAGPTHQDLTFILQPSSFSLSTADWQRKTANHN
jgi:hypothetical protein